MEPEDAERPSSRRGFAAAMADAAGSLLRAAASAGEILSDPHLRKRGAAMLIGEASRGIQGLQRGLEEGANNTLGMGFKHVQSVLRDIERKVAEFQHQQRARDPSALADWARRQPVDVQIGAAVHEDMPPEVRGRLYAAMAAHPDLADALREQCIPNGAVGGASRSVGIVAGSSRQQGDPGPGLAQVNGVIRDSEPCTSNQRVQQEGRGEEEGTAEPGASPWTTASCAVDPGSSSAGRVSRNKGGHSGEQSNEETAADRPAATATAEAAAVGASSTLAVARLGAMCDGSVLPPCAPTPWNSTSQPAAPSPWQLLEGSAAGAESRQEHPTAPLDDAIGDDSSANTSAAAVSTAGGDEGASPKDQSAAAVAAAGVSGLPASPHPVTSHPVQVDVADEWEVLGKDSVGGAVGDSGTVEAVETVRTLLQSMMEGAPLDPALAAQAAMLEAMLEVDWPSGGPECAPPPDAASEYAQLAATPAGQAVQRCMGGVEPIDDVIARDLGRTFPEHPMFTEGNGQARLGRLLRAFALRDEEIGYCQGQAFAAGLLLMFASEEDAFKLYCRLMDPPPVGAGLRRLYLPGLEPLKLELSRFELLLASHLPALHAHLQSAGLPAVLYASSWLMTLFASPFPISFAGRVLDVLLVTSGDAVGVLLRVALAMLEALQSELLAHDDFEGLITAIKVGPLQWPLQVYRHVLDRALSADFITDNELAAAWTAAVAEAARLGRPSSFTSRRLMRTKTAGGTERLVLSPLTEAEDGEGIRAEGAAGGNSGTAATAGAILGSADETVVPSAPSGSSAASTGAAAAGAGAAHPPSSSAAVAGAAGVSGVDGASFPDLSDLDEFEAVLRDLAYCGILPDGAEGDDGSQAPLDGDTQQQQQQQQQQSDTGGGGGVVPQQQQSLQQNQQQQQQQHSHVVVL